MVKKEAVAQAPIKGLEKPSESRDKSKSEKPNNKFRTQAKNKTKKKIRQNAKNKNAKSDSQNPTDKTKQENSRTDITPFKNDFHSFEPSLLPEAGTERLVNAKAGKSAVKEVSADVVNPAAPSVFSKAEKSIDKSESSLESNYNKKVKSKKRREDKKRNKEPVLRDDTTSDNALNTKGEQESGTSTVPVAESHINPEIYGDFSSENSYEDIVNETDTEQKYGINTEYSGSDSQIKESSYSQSVKEKTASDAVLNAPKNEKITSSAASPKPRNKSFKKRAKATQGAKAVIESNVEEKAEGGNNADLQAAVAGEKVVSFVGKNTLEGAAKGRQISKKASDIKALATAYGIHEMSRTALASTVLGTKSSLSNVVKTGGSSIKKVIREGIAEAGENDIAFKAVDTAITAVNTVKTSERVVVGTGKIGVKAVKTAVSVPKKTAKGIQKVRRKVKKMRKFAKMSGKAKRKVATAAAKKTAAATVKVAVAAVKMAIDALISIAFAFAGPVVIIIIIIALVAAILLSVSLKSEDSELTKTWEYITELDCKFSQKYMEKWAGFPFDEEGVCESMADDPDIRIKRVFKVNGIETGSGNIPYRSDIDAWLLYLDCKYEDYTFSEVKDEIDELYSEVNSLSFETDRYTESVGEGEDARVILVYELTVNANIKNFRTYIDSNKDTLFTPSQIEMYNAITEVGQYVTRADLANPFGEDTILFSSRRYGKDIIPENVYGEDGFYLGMTPSSYLSLLERHDINIFAGDEFVDLLNTYKIEMHKGLDLKAASGADIYAPIGGEITVSGNSITIEDSKKRLTVRGISSTALSTGHIVRKGDKIGITGDDGYICLEYEVKNGLTYTYQNPAFYLGNVTYEITSSFSDADTPIDLSMYEISDELKGTARSVVEAALAMVGAGGYDGACAKVASTIYQNAGLGYHGGNGNDFSRANRLVVDGGHVDYTKIPVGAYIGIKYGTGSAGYLYGHVGVYVGLIGGVPCVVEGGGSTGVALTPLDHFYDYFVTSNPNSVYGNEIGWNITSTGGSVSPLYFER